MEKKPDPAHVWTDEQLSVLEKRIAAEYKKAAEELQEKIDAYFASFEKRDAETKKLIGTIVNGKEYTAEDYKQWRLAQIGRGKRFEALRDAMAYRMTKANEITAIYINQEIPSVYSLNRNYAAYELERVYGDMGFALIDEKTVERLLVKQPDLMPYYPPKRAVKRGIDLAYGKRQITAQVTTGILQGEGLGKIADRLQNNIPDMNRTAALRAARTAMTSAENGGRYDTYREAKKRGKDIKVMWVATLDSRTRHTHRELDGKQQEIDEPFEVDGEEILYPGYPFAVGHLLYNCRCRIIPVVAGVDYTKAKRRVRNPETGRNEVVDYQTYKEWEAKKSGG